MECTITHLNFYPLKSAGAISVSELDFTLSGPKWDRNWLLTKPNGQFLTQRTHPRMSLIGCKIGKDSLTLSLPSGETRQVPLSQSNESSVRPVIIFGKEAKGLHINEDLDLWLSDFLETDVQLLRSSEQEPRTKISKVEKIEIPIDFADGYPALLINQSSVDSFQKTTGVQFGADRFRGNIVVTGLPPFKEDEIHSFSTPTVTLLAEKTCTRCTIINVDQEKGTKSVNILSHLKKERPSPKGPLFGQNLSIKKPGQLRVGETMKVQLK